jgi:hypothetical protein
MPQNIAEVNLVDVGRRWERSEKVEKSENILLQQIQ